MATVAYSAFFPYLIPLVPHVAEPVAEHAVRSACIEFCKETLLWREPMEPISTTAGEAAYELDVPGNTGLAHVIELYYMGRHLTKKSVSELSGEYGRDWMQAVGTPTMFTMHNPNEITLVYKPDKTETNSLTGLLAFAPTRKSTTVIDYIFEEYAEEITRGAAARLMLMPNQQWSDPKGGVGYHKQFSADCANGRSHANAGQVRAPISVHMRRYW